MLLLLIIQRTKSASCVLLCDRAQEIRTERQRKALEAQQAEQRRLEEERFGFSAVCVMVFSFFLNSKSCRREN